MLKNATYTGRLVWNRLDFATQRDVGGSARLRAREEWAVAEVTHLPLVSEETFAAAQERFRGPQRGGRGRQSRDYLFTGMVKCCSGHGPLSMYGRTQKGHRYYACDYLRDYGDSAAIEVHGGKKWIYLREDRILALVEKFFAERIFGPMRIEKVERQLRAHGKRSKRKAKSTGKRVSEQIADLDRRIGLQIDALEKGIEPKLVGERIAQLRGEKERAEAALRDLAPETDDADAEELLAMLIRLPDLAEALAGAPRKIKRQVFEAFCLEIRFDKVERRIEISATVSEAVAQAFESAKGLHLEAPSVTTTNIAGARYFSE